MSASRLSAALAAALLALLTFLPAGAYGLYAAALYLLQDALIFPAPDVPAIVLAAQADAAGADEFWLETADGVQLYGWHVDRGGDRLLLYFHGNGGGVGAAGWFAEQLPGWDVVSISYRGYPGSDGTPSEAGLLQDGQAAWLWVTDGLGIPADRVVVQGQSLGGGVALALLADVEPAALVLDSTFFSLAEVAGRQAPGLPVSWLVKHPFRSDLRAPSVATPALVMHGTHDELIPLGQGLRLSQRLPRATWLPVEGKGHGHWLLEGQQPRRAWKAFLEERVPRGQGLPSAG